VREAVLDPAAPAVTIERAVLRQSLVSLITLGVELGSDEMEIATRVAGEQVVVSVAGSYADPTTAAANLSANDRWQMIGHLLEPQGATLEMRSDDRRVAALVRAPMTRGHKVLIVEDNPDVVQLYRRYLGGGRYHVLSSADGRAGLASAEAEQPSIVILDLMMPGQDGWEVLQLLKSNPATRQIPVVVCSVLKERDLALALGAVDFLAKPVTRADLVAVLERHLNPGEEAPRA
jgi:CheY-like chemotaxis protein